MKEDELKTEEGFEEILAARLVRSLRDAGDGEEESAEPRAINSQQFSGRQQSVSVREASTATSAEFVKVEKSLIGLGYFTPSSRRIKTQAIKSTKFTRTIDGKKVEVSAEFHPSPVFGLPITADQDKFLALHHIITNLLKRDGRISNPIRFTSSELLRLLETRRGGKQYKDISEWLDVMTSTTIISNGVVWEAGRERYARDRFHVFSRAVSFGKELPDGSIADANFVWLSDWQLENINEKHILPIDILVYRELKNHIAKALVPLLQIWLYASQKAGSFEKKYRELCEVLGLQVFKAPSRITQQLKASFDELVRHEYLEKWRIERTADHREFKILFFHGPKFHRDRDRRRAERGLAESTTVVAEWQAPEPTSPEPGGLEIDDTPTARPASGSGGSLEGVKHPSVAISEAGSSVLQIRPTSSSAEETGNRASVEIGLVDELSARGLMPSAALRLLHEMPPDRLETVGDYIDYFDFTRRTKTVGEGFLYSLIKAGDPLPANFETRKQRDDRLERLRRSENLRRLQDEMRVSYEAHCKVRLDRFIAEELGPEEFLKRVEQRKTELLQHGGFFDGMSKPDVIAGFATDDVRRNLAAGLVTAYDDYCDRQLPAVLERLGLNPTDVGLSVTGGPNEVVLNDSSPNEGSDPVERPTES